MTRKSNFMSLSALEPSANNYMSLSALGAESLHPPPPFRSYKVRKGARSLSVNDIK